MGVNKIKGKLLLQTIQYQGLTFDLVDLTAVNPTGNKFYKLKKNLTEAQQAGHNKILTFGGAWSNHIHALAQIAPDFGMQAIGIIRGERPKTPSVTLVEAESYGMHLHFVSRAEYRMRNDPGYLMQLQQRYGRHLSVPEGGSNAAGIEGAAEIVQMLADNQIDYDQLVVPVGTGGTLAGIASKLEPGKSILGICVLKGAHGIEDQIEKFAPKAKNWFVDHEGHFGGYAKCPKELKTFILDFEDKTKLALDPVYSAKMICRLLELLNERQIAQSQTGQPQAGSVLENSGGAIRAYNQRLLAIHTGGLQGRRGFDF